MAQIDVDIASRRYTVACRDGGEDRLRSVAAMVDMKAREAGDALGALSEARQLLFASLMVADDLYDARSGVAPAAPAPSATDPAVANALERLAERMERLAERLEQGGSSS